MPLIRQEEVYPSVKVPWAQAIEVYASSAVVQGDVVVLDGMNGAVVKATPADADNAPMGQQYVATGKAAAGDKFLAVPWMLLTDVNTNGSSTGAPVYLNTTAGGWTLTKPSGADDLILIVGRVLKVSATVGVVRLEPGGVPAGAFKVGSIVVASGVTTGVVNLGTAFASGKAVATLESTTGATNYVTKAAINGAGSLTVTVDTAPGGSDTATVSYIAFVPDL